MSAAGYVYNDGGRKAAGYKGSARDCVARSIAIASGLPYAEVYKALAKGAGSERLSKGASARDGIHTKRQWFKDYMHGLGFAWTATMRIGSGCKVHLDAAELPRGALVVMVSKHCTAMVDGVVHDDHDPRRASGRCVYGYWQRNAAQRALALTEEASA